MLNSCHYNIAFIARAAAGTHTPRPDSRHSQPASRSSAILPQGQPATPTATRFIFSQTDSRTLMIPPSRQPKPTASSVFHGHYNTTPRAQTASSSRAIY